MTAVSGGGPGVVLGIGLNVSAAATDLPWGATSLAAQGVTAGRAEIAVDAADPPGRARAGLARGGGRRRRVRPAQRLPLRCASLGSRVRVERPSGDALHGMAEDVDPHGRLLVLPDAGERRAVAAGDVVHLRPADHPDR